MADARPRSPVRPPPNVGFDEVQGDLYVDEELTPWYSPETWYPVRLGAVYNDRYQALVKLGYGSASTTWLCRDLEGHCYVTLKVYEQNSAQAATEKAAHEHLKQIRSKHPGQKFIRKLKDSFEVHWREGSNVCLVFDALAISVKARREMFVGDRFPWGGVRFILYAVLQALDFLHTRARLVHTDLSDSNIVISTKDEAYFDALVEDVRNGPGPRKRHGDRDIYPHRLVDMPEHPGEPIICDFGEAEWGKPSYSRVAMPNIDRAPEMVLHIDWKEKIDIWALGCMVWHMVEGKPLFHHARGIIDEHGVYAGDKYHLARIIALLGLPPKDFIERGRASAIYFDKDGEFLFPNEVPAITLENEEETLEGQGEEKKGFLLFIRRCLQWRPEDRSTARELVHDPWLKIQFEKPKVEPALESIAE